MELLGKLEKVEIRKVWPKEDSNFTPWLASPDNIALLGAELNIDLEVQFQEQYVGPFRADILCKDTLSDRYVLIENQFGKTDHTHLGQIITYASGLHALTVIWIAEKFVEEHRAALDWLNEITDESVEFFGIEIELYKIGDSAPAPMFNIISKPNNWSKSIKRSAENTELTETKLLQLEFWKALKTFVEKGKATYRMQKPSPYHWTNISVGRSDFKICAIANTRDKLLCIQLVVYGPNSQSNYLSLKEKYKEDASHKLSPLLQWDDEKENGMEHHVNYIIHDTDPFNRTDWPNQHKLLNEWIEKFMSYFKNKIKDL
jgi:hypothetical protein